MAKTVDTTSLSFIILLFGLTTTAILALPQRLRFESRQPNTDQSSDSDDSLTAATSNAEAYKHLRLSMLPSSRQQQQQRLPSVVVASLPEVGQQNEELFVPIQQLQGLKPAAGIRKRHCWDVTDVCCMWSIC
jgi:hypothetical protein